LSAPLRLGAQVRSRVGPVGQARLVDEDDQPFCKK